MIWGTTVKPLNRFHNSGVLSAGYKTVVCSVLNQTTVDIGPHNRLPKASHHFQRIYENNQFILKDDIPLVVSR